MRQPSMQSRHTMRHRAEDLNDREVCVCRLLEPLGLGKSVGIWRQYQTTPWDQQRRSCWQTIQIRVRRLLRSPYTQEVQRERWIWPPHTANHFEMSSGIFLEHFQRQLIHLWWKSVRLVNISEWVIDTKYSWTSVNITRRGGWRWRYKAGINDLFWKVK